MQIANESKIAAKWARKRAALEKAEAAEWAAFWARHLPAVAA